MGSHRQRDRAQAGVTLLELLLSITIIAVLAALLLPSLTKARVRARQTDCLSRLKEIGVAFHAFAHDHNSLFPMQVPAASGGTLEFAREAWQSGSGANAFRHFQALSNELALTKILVCPSDYRSPAPDFRRLANSNISYFVTLNPAFGQSDTVLAGDRNLAGAQAVGGLLSVHTNSPLSWTDQLHLGRGNLLFADGHVESPVGAEISAGFAKRPGGRHVLLPPVHPAPLGVSRSEPAAPAALSAGSPPNGSSPSSAFSQLERTFASSTRPAPTPSTPGSPSPPAREPAVATPAGDEAESRLPGHETAAPAAGVKGESDLPEVAETPAAAAKIWSQQHATPAARKSKQSLLVLFLIVAALVVASEITRRRLRRRSG
ncbi:MAG TPA: prepilin-type N-terminal cleavage/methylation domain-containing protein [Methylomirabilota bacterium]|nr:prepilin-type N-terminal cleavage/methylation domain-containing protein [Methylomirabilota bacterium]